MCKQNCIEYLTSYKNDAKLHTMQDLGKYDSFTW